MKSKSASTLTLMVAAQATLGAIIGFAGQEWYSMLIWLPGPAFVVTMIGVMRFAGFKDWELSGSRLRRLLAIVLASASYFAGFFFVAITIGWMQDLRNDWVGAYTPALWIGLLVGGTLISSFLVATIALVKRDLVIRPLFHQLLVATIFVVSFTFLATYLQPSTHPNAIAAIFFPVLLGLGQAAFSIPIARALMRKP